jgi:hypothetical protein
MLLARKCRAIFQIALNNLPVVLQKPSQKNLLYKKARYKIKNLSVKVILFF